MDRTFAAREAADHDRPRYFLAMPAITAAQTAPTAAGVSAPTEPLPVVGKISATHDRRPAVPPPTANVTIEA